MIEDATKPVIEPFEIYPDYELKAEPQISVERNMEQPVTLNLKDAAFALGKSMRALERSLSGKWGNKLPDGWTARKVIIDDSEEWEITPPLGFNLQALYDHNRETERSVVEANGETPQSSPSTTRQIISKAASKLAFAKPMMELHLLRELAATHKELSEERRAHLEDLRLLSELQSSMRLLKDNAQETAKLKEELIAAQKDLIALKNQYQEVLNMPWWKRIFVGKPQQ
ncbi:MAG: hypothetical protein JST44_01980 [Cyanobacteria bacterium SZAS LIN-5]|nr:hypothetical protein [Cyanobacteria bacterium SZAS LIN-5]